MSEFDIVEYARNLMKKNIQANDSKLDTEDVKDILIKVIADLDITHSEKYELDRVMQYYPKSMTLEAGRLFKHFYDVLAGTLKVDKQEYELYEFAKKLLKEKKKGKDSQLDYDDVREICLLIVRDGRLSRFELEELTKIIRIA